MKRNFIRINNMLLKKMSDQIEKFFVQNKAKNDYFSKCALGMNFHWIVPDSYPYGLHKNAEKTGVILFLSQIFCQKAVRETEQSKRQIGRQTSFNLENHQYPFNT